MINFNDTGLIVTYIQTFLKENYNRDLIISGVYNKETHKNLIEYLKQPYVLSAHQMKDQLIQFLTFNPEDDPDNALIQSGGLFNFDNEITTDTIKFYTRPLDDCFRNGLLFINQCITLVDNIAKLNGWEVIEYTNYNSDENINKEAFIYLVKSQNPNLIPGLDVLNMINLFSEDYLLNKCFLDDNQYHGYIQYSDRYKIAYIDAKPGESFTIMHGYKNSCEIAIAYTEQSLLEINDDLGTVNNILNHLTGSEYGELNSGKYLVYTIPNDVKCKYLLIQLPYINNLTITKNKVTNILLGDINQDGVVDKQDYELLKQYVDAIENNSKLPFVLSGKNLLAANVSKDVDINGNPIIDKKDLVLLNEAIISNKSLGFIKYEEKLDLETTDSDKLLIMYGNIEYNNENNELNIPYYDFVDTPWLVHDEFIPYILGSTIHKFSNKNDIIWAQEKLNKLYNYNPIEWGKYDEPIDYITNNEFRWNNSKSRYEYYRNGRKTQYVLEKNDLSNSKLINSDDPTDDPKVFILNNKLFENNIHKNNMVLSNGYITSNDGTQSLKYLILQFQLAINKRYKLQNGEQIKFINGYVNPLTEKYLNLAIDE